MDLEELQQIIKQEQREENINALFENRDAEEIAYMTDLSNGNKLRIDKDGMSIEVRPIVESINVTISITSSF